MPTDLHCPSCTSAGLETFYEQDQVPSHSCLLLSSPEEARAFPRGTIRLAFCPACGFMTNTAYDPELERYSTQFEESQGFSPRFQAFANDLASHLVETYDLRGKQILEIGCGKGEFLALLCDLGDNRGVGIDPAFVDNRLEGPTRERLTFINDYFSERHAHLTGDMVLCRHTLEHIPDTREFLKLVRRSVEGRDIPVVFELPDARRVLREAAFWDIYYEHCSYFTPGSLARLFRSVGFDVHAMSLEYDDQYILIEARPSEAPDQRTTPLEETPEELRADISDFQEKLAARKQELGELKADGRRTVIWGAQSKGVAFLTTLEVQDEIEYAVDINPFKHDTYMAGTGQRVVAPEFLREFQPELVIAMNPVYREEIQRDLDRLGVAAELVTV